MATTSKQSVETPIKAEIKDLDYVHVSSSMHGPAPRGIKISYEQTRDEKLTFILEPDYRLKDKRDRATWIDKTVLIDIRLHKGDIIEGALLCAIWQAEKGTTNVSAGNLKGDEHSSGIRDHENRKAPAIEYYMEMENWQAAINASTEEDLFDVLKYAVKNLRLYYSTELMGLDSRTLADRIDMLFILSLFDEFSDKGVRNDTPACYRNMPKIMNFETKIDRKRREESEMRYARVPLRQDGQMTNAT